MRRPLNHVVLIVVNSVDVRKVEVTGDELLMVPDLVKVVREASVRALLLERAASLALQVVACMVHFLLTPLIRCSKGSIVHVHRKHLTRAIGVLKLSVGTYFAIVACIKFFTIARTSVLVEAAEAIALKCIRLVHRVADSVLAVVSSESRVNLFGIETLLALFALLAGVGWRALTLVTLGKLGLSEGVANILLGLENRGILTEFHETVRRALATLNLEIEVIMMLWVIFTLQ